MKNILFITILSFLLILSCSKNPHLNILGDIPLGTYITNTNELPLLIEKYNISHLFIVTKDSTAIEIIANQIYQIDIMAKNGVWSSESKTLPRTANLKNISYIAVKSDFIENRLSILKRYDIGEYITPYNYIMSKFDYVGSSELDEQGLKKYTNKVAMASSPLNLFENNGIINGGDAVATLLVIYTSGQEAFYTEKEIDQNLQFNGYFWFISPNDTSPITIIWQNYPNDSIYDIYPLIEKITSINPLLLIFIDGLGWNMLENLTARGWIPPTLIKNHFPLRVAYPPRTIKAYQALNNNSPDRELFADLEIKTAYIIENDQSYFHSRFPILLHTDRNNSGSIDDEIFETAMEYLDKDFALMMVHFHSIDDIAHEYGPYGAKTRQQIETVFGYIEELLGAWNGDFMIFSDHGLHWDDGGGRHGTNNIEDMVGVLSWGCDNISPH